MATLLSIIKQKIICNTLNITGGLKIQNML